MNGFMLACLRAGIALAIAATLAPCPAIAAANDAWPGIRADYREGNFAGALSSLKALLATNPGDREALYYTAIIHWRLEDYTSAAAAYRQVLALDAQGPFGHDARMWLDTYGHLAAPAPKGPQASAPARMPLPRPSAAAKVVRPRPTASPVRAPKPAARVPAPSASPGRVAPRRSVLPLEALRPTTSPRAPWLQAQPGGKNRRARSANPRPGYFKVADGSFEFVPPAGFVLLDEGAQGSELSTLFGLPKDARTSEASPTLLITWREFADLKDLRPDQRSAKERQLLTMEASMYGPGAQLEARFGGPCYRVRQSQGTWAADTLLFFQHGKLYALTFGGAADQLARHQASVLRSWETPIFYP
jgi:hypothetical protein